jgi:hypothetical protein
VKPKRSAQRIAHMLEGDILTVRIPMTFKRIGGRKVIIAPEGCTDWAAPLPKPDNTLLRALARAYRWQKLLETGNYRSIDELAKAEKINPSYLGRILRLVLLAPDLVEAVLDGCQLKGLTVERLTKSIPTDWNVQRADLSAI